MLGIRNLKTINFPMSDTIRAFIGFELPEKIISYINKIQEDIKGYRFKVRWVRPGNIHLTLKFLGDIDRSDTEKVGKAIAESAKETVPVSLAVKGIGVFPDIKRPRVVWCGIAGNMDSLTRLHKTLDENLALIGFQKEKRPFKGHLTLGRVKEKINSKRLLDAIKAIGGLESEPFIADQIILFKSELKPAGAVYTKLKTVSLR